MCARESSFFAGNADGRRGWAAAVTLTKVAQLENRGGHFAADADDDEGEEWRRESSRERDRDEAENIRVLLGISIYFASNLHVSLRVSSLFRAQHSCGTAISRSLPSGPVSRLSEFFFVFFLRIIATTRKQMRNPLVTSTHHPSAVRIQIYPRFRDGGDTVEFRDEKYGWIRAYVCFWQFI